MKTIIKIFVLFAVVFALLPVINILKAQENSALYFSRQPQAANYNPAFMSNNKFYITPPLLGRFAVDIHTSGFAYHDLINQHPDFADSLRLDVEGFLGKLKDNNNFSFGMNFDLIGLGFKIGKNYFSVGSNLTVETKIGFSKNLFDFAVHGTNMSSKSLDVLNRKLVDATAYAFTYIGYAREITDQLTVGARFKIYTGVANVHTNKSIVNLQFDGEEVAAYGDFDIYASTFFGHFMELSSVINDHSDFSFEREDDVAKSAKNIKDNKGYGFDIGATYQLNETMQISASIIDIGKITWKTNAAQLRSSNPNERIVFSGVDVDYNNISEDLEDYFDDMADSLKHAFDMELHNIGSYSTSVPTKIYVGYSWEFFPHMNLQALYSGRFIAGSYENALTLNYSLFAGPLWLSVGNTVKYTWFNPSVLLSLGSAFYIGASFSSSYNLAKTSGMNFYAGFNFAVKNKKKAKFKPVEQPAEEILP